MEGITGALVQWIVVSISSVGLAILLRSVEERYGSLAYQRFAGLGAKVPRIAVFFLLFALALVGFPGTLGFWPKTCFSTAPLEAHPFIGIALPVATALIAIRLLGLFSSMFLGRLGSSVPAVADAMPRERWVLTAMIALLVVAGLVPQTFIDSRARPAYRSHHCWELETWRRISRSPMVGRIPHPAAPPLPYTKNGARRASTGMAIAWTEIHYTNDRPARHAVRLRIGAPSAGRSLCHRRSRNPCD